MTTSEEVTYVYDLAKQLLDEMEPVYGDSWKQVGFETCFEQIPRKSTYLKVQHESGNCNVEKMKKDLLDLLNWCAIVYTLVEKGEQ